MERRGQPFSWVGSSERPSASAVAAGIMNPVTGRWMTGAWRFSEFAPFAASTYRKVGERFDQTFHHPLEMRRYFMNEEDAKRGGRRARNPRYAESIGALLGPGEQADGTADAFGSLQIRGAGYVDLPQLLSSVRSHFTDEGSFREASFDHSSLSVGQDKVTRGEATFSNVFFCEGAALRENPWFRDLPLKPVKGETLLLMPSRPTQPHSLRHRSKWLLAYPDSTCRLGATYDESDLTESPTEEARAELIEALEGLLPAGTSCEVVEQKAGLRPSTADQKPLLGKHPAHSRLVVFNGLGSKGATTAPWLAHHLCDHVFEGRPLDPEVDIARFA